MSRGRPILGEVRVNGAQRGLFVVDTGASAVALSGAFARRLGLSLEGAPTVKLGTANGMSTARLTQVQSLQLQGARVGTLEVLVTDGLPEGVDGLLGLPFLARFDMRADARAGRLELTERTSGETRLAPDAVVPPQ